MMTEPRYDQISLRSFVTDKVIELRLLTVIISIPNAHPQYLDMNQQSSKAVFATSQRHDSNVLCEAGPPFRT